MSLLVAAVFVLLTVLLLTPLFTDLPTAVLAALIIHAVIKLMNVKEMRRYFHMWPGVLVGDGGAAGCAAH